MTNFIKVKVTREELAGASVGMIRLGNESGLVFPREIELLAEPVEEILCHHNIKCPRCHDITISFHGTPSEKHKAECDHDWINNSPPFWEMQTLPPLIECKKCGISASELAKANGAKLAKEHQEKCEHDFVTIPGWHTDKTICKKCNLRLLPIEVWEKEKVQKEFNKPQPRLLAPGLFKNAQGWWIGTRLFSSLEETKLYYSLSDKIIWPAVIDPKTGMYVVEDEK